MAASDSTSCSVYRITCSITDQNYVGQTANASQRKYSHFCMLNLGKHKNNRLQEAFNLYGKKAFVFAIVETGIPAAKINEREQYWIDYYDSYNSGFNLTVGGSTTNPVLGKSIEWNGVSYPSIHAAARSLGIATKTLRERLNKGYRYDSDVRPHARYSLRIINDFPVHEPCVWNGIKYPSIKVAATKLNVSLSTMQMLIRLGKCCNNLNLHPPA